MTSSSATGLAAHIPTEGAHLSTCVCSFIPCEIIFTRKEWISCFAHPSSGWTCLRQGLREALIKRALSNDLCHRKTVRQTRRVPNNAARCGRLFFLLVIAPMPHLHVGPCQQSFEFSYTLFLQWSRCLRGVRNDVHVPVEHNHLEKHPHLRQIHTRRARVNYPCSRHVATGCRHQE